MSYKEREITGIAVAFFGGGTAEGDGNIQRDIEAHNTVVGDNGVIIPFHALEGARITTEMVDRDDRNPYNCEPKGGGGGSSTVDKAKACLNTISC